MEGVGYLRRAPWVLPTEPARACLLSGRGKPGEEDSGSNGGRRLGAGRLTPATGRTGSWARALGGGEESMAKTPGACRGVMGVSGRVIWVCLEAVACNARCVSSPKYKV